MKNVYLIANLARKYEQVVTVSVSQQSHFLSFVDVHVDTILTSILVIRLIETPRGTTLCQRGFIFETIIKRVIYKGSSCRGPVVQIVAPSR
jgi:hypothetical protein